MASGQEIIEYIRDVNRKFELDRWIQFKSAVEQAIWNEGEGKWKLRSRHNLAAHQVDSANSIQLQRRMVRWTTNAIS